MSKSIQEILEKMQKDLQLKKDLENAKEKDSSWNYGIEELEKEIEEIKTSTRISKIG